jgi:hypothetical protein
MTVNWNQVDASQEVSGLSLNRWVDLNWTSRFMEGNGTMDFKFFANGLSYDFSIAGNPFHHSNNSDIIFGRDIHAFVLNAKLFNQNLPKADIEGLQFDIDFEFDFNLPVCLVGQFLSNGACAPCHSSCEVCEGTADNCAGTCFDLECSSCDNSSEGSPCHDCSGNGKA